jgi:hypothetical protein
VLLAKLRTDESIETQFEKASSARLKQLAEKVDAFGHQVVVSHRKLRVAVTRSSIFLKAGWQRQNLSDSISELKQLQGTLNTLQLEITKYKDYIRWRTDNIKKRLGPRLEQIYEELEAQAQALNSKSRSDTMFKALKEDSAAIVIPAMEISGGDVVKRLKEGAQAQWTQSTSALRDMKSILTVNTLRELISPALAAHNSEHTVRWLKCLEFVSPIVSTWLEELGAIGEEIEEAIQNTSEFV